MKNINEYIPISYKIAEEIIGKPKSHKEWADRFNIIHRVIKVIEHD